MNDAKVDWEKVERREHEEIKSGRDTGVFEYIGEIMTKNKWKNRRENRKNIREKEKKKAMDAIKNKKMRNCFEEKLTKQVYENYFQGTPFQGINNHWFRQA